MCFPHQDDRCGRSWTRHESQYINSESKNGVVALLPHFLKKQKWGNRATTPFSEAAIMSRRLTLLALLLFALPGRAEVVRIELKSRTDLLAGKSFGSAGAFEKLSGKIYFAVDPRNSA